MEPAKIDWKRIESIFVEDELYEHINAPKWVDFLATQESVDDEAWFCRPNCKHPKTAEDFLKTSTPSKLTSSANGSESLPLRDQSRREEGLLNLQLLRIAIPDFNEDSENQNPNLSTPPINHAKSTKTAIKSSTEKKTMANDMSQNNEAPRLKNTLSARNLFAGRDILNQITDFCNELKRMATRARERENERLIVEKCDMCVWRKRQQSRRVLVRRADEAENVPISLDLNNIRHKREENLLQIRTNPPSPQCFSATRGPTKTTPSKASKSRLMATQERGILQEVEQNKEGMTDESAEKGRTVSIADGKEARTLDVFWFLKPCTLSN
uniref:Uncharacterized protein n=1 Tax=Fagus sylvatica TaxID=28930 RepID=A0A2N9II29_FAGSY